MIFRRLLRLPSHAFSEAVQSVAGHKAPAFTDTPSGKYAGSLFSAASEKGALQSCLEDLTHLREVLKESSSFREVLKNSAISRNKQREIFSTFQEAYHPVTLNFLTAIIDNGRLSDLEKTIDTYIKYCKILNKEEDIRVISAAELDAPHKEQVVAALKRNKPGVKFRVTYEVEPSILGGLQIFAGTEFLDCSLRSRVERLKLELARIA